VLGRAKRLGCVLVRKLIYSMTVSLDGYIAGPDGAIDWSVPDEELECPRFDGHWKLGRLAWQEGCLYGTEGYG
jgi:hypothetical protein